MNDLRGIARALGGEVVGRSVLAPAEGHSSRDRSLWVTPKTGAPDGLLVHLFSGAGGLAADLEAKGYVLGRLGLGRSFRERRADSERDAAERRRDAEAEHRDRDARIRRARELWGEARDPRGTVVERYLASRMIDLDDGLADVAIRFHPEAPFRDGSDVVRHPAMIACMRGIVSDAIEAVHRTALSPDGRKLTRRMQGPAGGCCVKLDADEFVTGGLTVGEGLETTLTARALGMRPAWAMCSTGGIAALPALSGIEALTVLEEDDGNGASAKAAAIVGERWYAAGREVTLFRPRVGNDLNDAVRAACA